MMLDNAEFLTVPPIPTRVTSLDGQQIDTSMTIWRVRESAEAGRLYPLDWSRLAALQINGQSIYSPRAQHLVKLYLADGLTRLKGATIADYFRAFLAFGRWLEVLGDATWAHFEWAALDEPLFRRYLDWCTKNYAAKGDRGRALRTFIKWGAARQYPDFSLQEYRALQEVPIASRASKRQARLRHITRGVLSGAEKQLVIQSLAAEKGRAEDRVIVMLHLELGLNPAACVRMLNRDFKCIETLQGALFQLDVPRVKKGTAHRETKRRPLSRRLGQLLMELQEGGPEDRLLHWLGDRDPESSIIYRMERWVKSVSLVSPRTNELLHLTPRRFRYTLATHLAEEGASKQHIAEVLDHSSLRTVSVYVEATSLIVEPVARATDAALEALVHLFLGKVAEDVDKGPTSQTITATVTHLPLPVLNAGHVGVCGRDVLRDGLCQLFPPLSCYLCPSFIAWRDGPHRELLASLNTYTAAHTQGVDERILQQLRTVQEAIDQVLRQIESSKGGPVEEANGQ